MRPRSSIGHARRCGRIASIALAAWLGRGWPAARAEPPLVAKATPAPAAVERFVLPNGLDVILAENHALPDVTLEVRWKVGHRDDPPGRRGMGELLSMLISTGETRHFPGASRAEVCAALGSPALGRARGQVTRGDHTRLIVTAAPRELDLLLWLESDRFAFWIDAVSGPAISAARSALIRWAGESTNPSDFVRGLARARAYGPAHPLAHLAGSGAGDLARVTPAEVRARASALYGPRNAILTLTGDFSASRAKELVTRYFGPIVGDAPPAPAPPPAPVRLDAEVRLVFEAPIERPRLVALWPTAPWFHPDDLALDVLGHVLQRRLSRALVEAEKLASSVEARQRSTALGSDFSIEITAAGTHDAMELLARLDRELERLRASAPSAEETAQAVARQIADLLVADQQPLERVNTLAGFAQVRDDPGYGPRLFASYRAVGAEQIRAVAGAQLPRARRVLAFALPNPGAPRAGRLRSEERR